ncbi:hypothetical protein [Streptacidiphilus sp. PAMC 29251]
MIEFRFSVRPGQGEASGFDLGDMVCSGQHGSAHSAGQVPDQGMMIYLSVALLLDQVSDFVRSNRSHLAFTGADSSYSLDFRAGRNGISILNRAGLVAVCSRSELLAALLEAAERFSASHAEGLPEADAGRVDFLSALQEFRGATAALRAQRG